MLIEKLTKSIKEYEEEESIQEYDAFVERFGTPRDIIISYYESMDSDYLLLRMRQKKYAVIAFIIVVLSIICFSRYKWLSFQKLYNQVEKEIVACEEITITESEPELIEE